MMRFQQMKSLQKIASVHASISNRFNFERSSLTGKHSRLAVRLPWRGGSCSPARSATSGLLRKVESGSHLTDSTASCLNGAKVPAGAKGAKSISR
jgi:hypothetical protein